MKVKKILDSDNIQGFKILNPTKKFKKTFPKKYIMSFDVLGKHQILNTNTLPNSITLFTPLGYIFTYADSLPKILKSQNIKYENIGSTFVRCLDTYFIGENEGDSENIDLILACGSKNKIVPPTFTDELIIRCNSDTLTGKSQDGKSLHNETEDSLKSEQNSNNFVEDRKNKIKNIKENILKIVSGYLKEKKYKVEDWVKDIIFNYPINNNGLPVRFPTNISDNNINNFTLNADDIFIEYDFRAKSYEHENEFISELEDAFESPNEEIQITNTYNNVLDEIKKKLDEKKYKWSKIDDNTIKTKLKYLRDINVEYQLTDFI